jgi:mono/diheme cytochrome c family protein
MILSIVASLALQTAPLVIVVKGAPRPPTKGTTEQIASGQATYVARCQLCHGKDGNADTAIGRAMKPPPQRFTDAVWQAKVKDAEIAKAILEGGAAVKKSPAMPAFKEFAAGGVDHLVAFIRSLRAPVAIVNVLAGDAVSTHVAPVGPDGSARIVVNGVTGQVTVLGVLDEGSLPYCTVDVAEAAGATVTCAARPTKTTP